MAAYRSGAPAGTALGVGIGAFLFTYVASIWVTHWMGVGSLGPTLVSVSWELRLALSWA